MKAKVLVISLALILTISTTAFAHSGRTDSSGGHNCSGSGSSGGSSITSPSTKAPTAEPKKEVDTRLKATLPSYKVKINDTEIDNSYAEYPVLSYKNITYFPMTWAYTQALGVDVNWSDDTGFSIRKTDNQASVLSQKKGSYNNPNIAYIIDLPAFNIFVNDSWLDNSKQDYPVIVYKDITYFPMTWNFAVDELGLTINYDSTNGFSIRK